MRYEIELEDCTVDNGYGEHCATIIVDVEPIIEDCSFDAYNLAGISQTYGSKAVIDVKIIGGTAFLTGNNGIELGEIELDSDDILKHTTKDYLIETLDAKYKQDGI